VPLESNPSAETKRASRRSRSRVAKAVSISPIVVALRIRRMEPSWDAPGLALAFALAAVMLD
jgi:hypothetical protein